MTIIAIVGVLFQIFANEQEGEGGEGERGNIHYECTKAKMDGTNENRDEAGEKAVGSRSRRYATQRAVSKFIRCVRIIQL